MIKEANRYPPHATGVLFLSRTLFTPTFIVPKTQFKFELCVSYRSLSQPVACAVIDFR